MSTVRTVKMHFTGQPTLEGAGVHLRRLFGFGNAELFDPFLLLDDFRSDTPAHYLSGFPWHPHRGIETITYVLKGDVEHGDSLGNHGTISSGDAQWMTAGSGIIHQEMPKGDANGSMHGFQLWANLPATEKMMTPRYRDINAGAIPEVELDDGAVVKVIAGRLGAIVGPADDIVTDPSYFDVALPAAGSVKLPTPRENTALIYVIGGTCTIAGSDYADGTLLVFSRGDQIAAEARQHDCRFLMLSGRPLGEPIAWRGPIVMNTQAELDLAFEEYRRGTFIKKS